jgi:exonuclease I
LSEKEHDEWFEIVQGRIQEGKYGYLSLDEFYKKLEKVRNKNPEKKALWKQLESYAESFL